jgi:polyhydroxyalkanoate synthesis regulator protein
LRQLRKQRGLTQKDLAELPHYLEASMDNFRTNQRKLQELWEASTGPQGFAQFAEHNMKKFQAAASAFMPSAKRAEPPSAKSAASGADLDALREQMAEMQRALDAHGIGKV